MLLSIRVTLALVMGSNARRLNTRLTLGCFSLNVNIYG
jgi:hypothetical protein